MRLIIYSPTGTATFSQLLVDSVCREMSRRHALQVTCAEDPAELAQAAELKIITAPVEQLVRPQAALINQLKQSDPGQAWLFVGGAVAWCAEAGVATDTPLCAHWQLIDSLRIRYPAQRFCTHLYNCESRWMSAAGGLATVDALLHWFSERLGGLAQQVADVWLLDKVRMGSERQRSPLSAHLGIEEPKLLEAIALMEANVEEPLATSEIADYLTISRRQLERLFKKHLQQVPSRYYLNLRLDVAQKMLLETPLSIVDIGARCGFSSGPHFSTAYRQRFEWTPREARSRHLKKMKDERYD
ncbi:GlxA family transcriptional regulator [Simiduia agarivorans]|uniref:AraC family transcriptional regulator n=1 Tax=Simiduia agarivorans (strain DSM 21679 / JCM 13881 / BCRC 17597 / SA1) TaxID=1117647 RepID=K4KJI7_SIMAS|nr:helix-turn-helix domain-containing protein [Simiduia agarivorans]AFU99314.1 AraC family transcriptional regulator [Simiduia agarivorans SA1 = DSM 21679]